MSYIFRSDAVEIGDRVVARRVVDGGHSDVIGHVLSLDPLRIRPQMAGGYPSDKDTIEIPANELHIIKKLSPYTVRNSDIRAVETATAKAFPGKEHTWTSDGQWLMRAGDGVTGRSNSAAPLGPSAGFNPVPIEEIDAFYRRHNLPTRLLVPERIGKPAERLITDWDVEPEILVMVARDLPATVDIANSAARTDHDFRFAITDQPDDAWLNLYHFRGQALPPKALEYLRQHIDGHMGFGQLYDAHGSTVAITRGTLTSAGNGDIWLGYSAVEVDPAFRRQGLATLLGARMLSWGLDHGADAAYLQVQASNTAGIGLYHKLGFVEQHRHRYATRISGTL